MFAVWFGAVWADDATLLVSYAAPRNSDPKNGLWTVDVTTGNATQVWRGQEQRYAVSPIAKRPDGRIVVSFPVILAQSDAGSDLCSAAVLNLETGEVIPITDGNGDCARLLGVSPDGALAIVSGGPERGFWAVDLDSFGATQLDIEPIRAAVTGEGGIVIAGAGNQPVVWTAENNVFFVVNLSTPVRVTLESGA